MKKLLLTHPDKKIAVHICTKQNVKIQIFREFKDGWTCWDTKPFREKYFRSNTYVTKNKIFG